MEFISICTRTPFTFILTALSLKQTVSLHRRFIRMCRLQTIGSPSNSHDRLLTTYWSTSAVLLTVKVNFHSIYVSRGPENSPKKRIYTG